MLPIETSVSHPCASASAASYSSLRILLPPKARPEAISSRLAQTSTSISAERRGKGWIGDGQKPSWRRGNLCSRLRGTGAPERIGMPACSTLIRRARSASPRPTPTRSHETVRRSHPGIRRVACWRIRGACHEREARHHYRSNGCHIRHKSLLKKKTSDKGRFLSMH